MLEQLNGDFIQRLRAFYYAAQTENIRKAAAMMQRHPSTLSYQISCLEKELHTTLFERSKTGLKLTPQGRKLRNWAVRTFENLDELLADVSSSPDVLQGDVSISTLRPMTPVVLDTIREFIRQNPGVRIHIQTDISQSILQKVEIGKFDMGLAGCFRQKEGLDYDYLFSSDPVLVLPRKNNWHIPRFPSWDDIAKLPIIGFRDIDTCSRDALHSIFYDNLPESVKERGVLSTNSYNVLLHYVGRGAGAAFLDELSFYTLSSFGFARDVVKYSLAHLLPKVNCAMVKRSGKVLSPQAAALYDFLKSKYLSLATLRGLPLWDALQSEIMQPGGSQDAHDSAFHKLRRSLLVKKRIVPSKLRKD